MRFRRLLAMCMACVIFATGCAQSDNRIIQEPREESEQDINHNDTDLAEQSVEVESTSTLVSEDVIHGDNLETDTIEVISDEKEEVDRDTIQEENNHPVEFHFAEEEPNYSSLNDPELLSYIEGTVYESMIENLGEGYFIENVEAIYISNEYLEEFAYNSQRNIYFGYSLDELDQQFQGQKYVFTLGEDGTTEVVPFEEYYDPYEQVIKDVAIGTGVILVCVTVSVVSAGVGAPAVSMVFAASAKTGMTMALSSGVIGGVAAGVVKGVETKDFDQALLAAAEGGAQGFKCGAIMGAIGGGASEAIALKGATLNGLTMNEAAMIQKETGYPLDVIKEFSSMEQYQICKDAGLATEMVDGKLALVREVDLFDYVDEMGRTNAQRIQEGLSPLDPSGIPYELHHIGQKADSTLAILTKSEHRLGENYKIWHEVVDEGVHSQVGNAWNTQRQQFWLKYLELATKAGGGV